MRALLVDTRGWSNSIDAFAARWRDSYPAVVHRLRANRESLTAYLPVGRGPAKIAFSWWWVCGR